MIAVTLLAYHSARDAHVDSTEMKTTSIDDENGRDGHGNKVGGIMKAASERGAGEKERENG